MPASFQGRFLVTLQVTLILALMILGWDGLVRHPGLILGAFAGSGILLSAVLAMRWHNLKVTPEPGAEAELCRRGPYRWIRHPMYSGILVLSAMFALGYASSSHPLAAGWLWTVLFIVLWLKLRMEERLWVSHHPEYGVYMKETRRLIPWIL